MDEYGIFNDIALFQSRNRGSFDFKSAPTVRLPKTPKRFNLVIEILLISRATLTLSTTDTDIRFQSRNRGSFDFKSTKFGIQLQEIEFQSRNRGSFDFKPNAYTLPAINNIKFQSRNRGTFGFKRDDSPLAWECYLTVSIS